MQITMKDIVEFKRYLEGEERTKNTIDKYVRDVCRFFLVKKLCTRLLDYAKANNESAIFFLQTYL